MTATANAVPASTANLHGFTVAWYACAIRFFAIARLAAPSRQAIASPALALASPAANLKRNNVRRNNRIHANACNLSTVYLKGTVQVSLKGKLPEQLHRTNKRFRSEFTIREYTFGPWLITRAG